MENYIQNDQGIWCKQVLQPVPTQEIAQIKQKYDARVDALTKIRDDEEVMEEELYTYHKFFPAEVEKLLPHYFVDEDEAEDSEKDSEE